MKTEKRQKIIAASIISIIIILSAFIMLFIGVPLVKFASTPEKFRSWVDSAGIYGKISYMGMVILQTIVALIPGEPFEIAAGYAFGALEGTILCLTASCIGSVLIFLLVRRFGIKLAEVFFPQEKLYSLNFLKSSPKRNFLFFIIFMIPGTPKDLLCYFAGLTDIKLPMWILIASVGRIPSVITSTVGGDALGTKNYLYALLVFALTLIISGAGLFIYSLIRKKHTISKEN